MAILPISSNTDLSRGFTVAQVAQKHGWTEPMVWSLALEGKDDLQRFEALNWGLRTWDLWDWNDCDRRFGDEWPGRIPGQMIARILYYFSKQCDLVFDPMGGGGVIPDVCLAFNRRCWTLDMIDQPAKRPEIEPYMWDIEGDFNRNSETGVFLRPNRNPISSSLIPLTSRKSGTTIHRRAYPHCTARDTLYSLRLFSPS